MFLKFKTSDKILQNYRYTLHELSDIQTEDENGVFTYSMDEGYEHVEVSNQSSIPNYIGEITIVKDNETNITGNNNNERDELYLKALDIVKLEKKLKKQIRVFMMLFVVLM